MGKQEDIDKLFEDTLHGYQEAPPADAWGAIQNRMTGEKRKKRAFAFRMAAASVALLIAFGAGYTYKGWKANDVGTMPIVIEDQPIKNNTAPTQEVTSPIIDNQAQETPLNAVAEESTLSNTTPANETVNNTSVNDNVPISNQSATIAANTLNTETTEQVATITPVEDEQPIVEESIIDMKPIIAENGANEGENNKEDDVTPTLAQLEQPTANPDTNNVPELVIDPKYKKNINPHTDARWALGAAATPLYSFRNASSIPNDNSANSLAAINNNNNEEAVVAYAGGINVNYKASSKWEISSGIYYSRQGIQTNNLNVVADATPGTVNSVVNLDNNNFSTNTSSGVIPLGTKGGTIGVVGFTTSAEGGGLNDRAVVSTNARLVQNFEYFEIPVMVRYNLVQKKVGVHLTGGLSANILSSNYSYVEANGNRQSVGETENIRDVNYSGVFGVGMNYSITDKLSFNIEPTIRYSITPINESSDINSFLYSMGVFTGISYNF